MTFCKDLNEEGKEMRQENETDRIFRIAKRTELGNDFG